MLMIIAGAAQAKVVMVDYDDTVNNSTATVSRFVDTESIKQYPDGVRQAWSAMTIQTNTGYSQTIWGLDLIDCATAEVSRKQSITHFLDKPSQSGKYNQPFHAVLEGDSWVAVYDFVCTFQLRGK